ncbi:uncharacterized protein LOC100909075 [Galendromus occidentalis]|uniref:Uncharacterized protein LOC100909075 n=1 Tax=Galendromus occidentalis TaxID=34638 RepID=A0AAJ6QTQ0_9ACAR|nr:uncharacterized protein LOC100909075 [Galendromus occidentalis]
MLRRISRHSEVLHQLQRPFRSSASTSDPDPSGKHDRIHMKELKFFVDQGRIGDAVLYYTRDIKAPKANMISYLIEAAGQTGNSYAAFGLMKDIVTRKITPSAEVLTSLFNTCADSKKDAIFLRSSVRRLYRQMGPAGWPANEDTYRAMIKAFARFGSTQTCFKLLDDLLAKGLPIKEETYIHLMMACSRDPWMGFMHAVRVMRAILWSDMKPSVELYDYFLLAVRKCSCGDNVDVLNILLNKSIQAKPREASPSQRVRQITVGDNLLDRELDGSLVIFSKLPEGVSQRLALVGGAQGLLKQMSDLEVNNFHTPVGGFVEISGCSACSLLFLPKMKYFG